MEWEKLQHSSLSDMLRDELVTRWAQDADAAYRQHRANAAAFAEHGNHELALSEIRIANEYRRRAAMWRAELLKAEEG